MNHRDEVIIEYCGQPNGWAKSGQLCPECQGGRSKEHSLRVSVQDGWLSWVCFRNSCGFKGKHKLNGGMSAVDSPVSTVYTDVIRTVPLDEKWEDFLSVLYNIEPGMLQWARWELCEKYKGKGTRIRMPIFGPDFVASADTWRAYDGSKPKAIITKRNAKGRPTMCWYKSSLYGKNLVVVEDQPSALRVCAAKVDALALCGTLLSPDRIEEIKQQKYERVVLCLDKDATATAVKAVAMFRAKLKGLTILPLKDDVKNMTRQDFELFIDEVTLP